ncbi:hypothetical protein ACFPVX_08285 [Cohnella faecalis]|uniref:hypothetical protein n=1 Tax=Cohnella faecalis TaxID=2315694 RepID=UPI0013140E62|nr:hypothetical protein [Cohnella faecalis]
MNGTNSEPGRWEPAVSSVAEAHPGVDGLKARRTRWVGLSGHTVIVFERLSIA